jgi:iron(II)-dependent oxidoreductase
VSFLEFSHKAGLLKLLRLCVPIYILIVAFPAFGQESSITNNMVLIDGGTFKRGCNRFGPQHGAPEQLVHLDKFSIDKYEVTNEKFEKIFPEHFLRRSIFSDCDQCPVSKISWYEAADYCHLIGKSLPSEAQWEIGRAHV